MAKVEWDGQVWQFDLELVTVSQALLIRKMTKDEVYPAGRSLTAYLSGVAEGEPMCLQLAWWQMHAQNDQPIGAKDIPQDLDLFGFYKAVGEAVGAETDPTTGSTGPDTAANPSSSTDGTAISDD